MSSEDKITAASWVARLSADEAIVRRIAQILSEDPSATDIAIATFETPSPANSLSWSLEAHFEAGAKEAELRGFITRAAGAQADRVVFERIDAIDWVQASLAGLTPVEAGRFVIHGAHARGRFPLNRIAIEIEAALAFGTGHHGTTRGCLLALAAILKARRVRNVLDVGTGTGVLAIAASLALREKVLATDIDALAVRIARDNARRNRAQVEAIHAPGVRSQRVRARAPYDLIFANILLGPLRILAAPVSRLLAPGGRIVLSGLLAAHANAAISAYRACGLVLESRLALEGWVTLVMRRPPKRQRPGRYPGRR